MAQKTEDVAVAEELQKKEDRSPLKLWDNFSLWRGECKELYFMYICNIVFVPFYVVLGWGCPSERPCHLFHVLSL